MTVFVLRAGVMELGGGGWQVPCKYVLQVLPGRFTNFSVCIAFLLHQFQMDLSNIDYLKVKVLFLSTLQIYVSNHNNTLAFSSSGLLATFIIAMLF